MRYALSTGETSSKPAGSAPQGSQLKSGWMKTGSVSRAIIIGNGNSDSKLMTRWKKKETLPSVAAKTEVSFAEIPYSPAVGREDMPGVIEADREPAAVIRTSTMSIEISNRISESLLSRILREVSHA